VWFQPSIKSAAVACDVTQAARERACAGLRLVWQRAVTLPTRRLGFLQPILLYYGRSAAAGQGCVRPSGGGSRRISLSGVAPRMPGVVITHDGRGSGVSASISWPSLAYWRDLADPRRRPGGRSLPTMSGTWSRWVSSRCPPRACASSSFSSCSFTIAAASSTST